MTESIFHKFYSLRAIIFAVFDYAFSICGISRIFARFNLAQVFVNHMVRVADICVRNVEWRRSLDTRFGKYGRSSALWIMISSNPSDKRIFRINFSAYIK